MIQAELNKEHLAPLFRQAHLADKIAIKLKKV
jgi:hypothetical protein